MFIYNSISIAELLTMKEFEDAELIAGEDGVQNEINWIHPMEIWDDPQKWLDGGELIFCSAMGVNDADELTYYFREVLKKNISGFCVQVHGYIHEIPEEMLLLANQHRCPLIVFRRIVRFIDLGKNLMSAILKYLNQEHSKVQQKMNENLWLMEWMKKGMSKKDIYANLNRAVADLRKVRYIVIVMECSTLEKSGEFSESTYYSITKKLYEQFEQNQFILLPILDQNHLAALVVDYGVEGTGKARLNTIRETVCQKINGKNKGVDFVFAAGKCCSDIDDVPKSYCNALETLEIIKKFRVNKFFYEDLNLQFFFLLLTSEDQRVRIKQFLSEQLSPLLQLDIEENGKYAQTLRQYYRCYGNKQLTAKALGITRQSLYYRLDIIKELLGFDLLNEEKRLTLELAFFFRDRFLE